MKRTAIFLAGYGVFLILIGLLGFLSNPEKAKTALMSGGLFGLLNIALGLLAQRGWRGAVPAGLGLAGFLALVFVWRASASWMAFANGESTKLLAAILITVMLGGTLVLVGALLRTKSELSGERPVPGS